MSDEESRIIPYETATRIFELADVLTGRAQGVYENRLAQIGTNGDHLAGNLQRALVELGTTPQIAREAIRAYSMSLNETLDVMKRVNGVINTYDASTVCGQILLQGLQTLYPTEKFAHGKHEEYSFDYGRTISSGESGELFGLTETFHAVPTWGLRRLLRKRAGKPLIDTERRVCAKPLGSVSIGRNADQKGNRRSLCTIRVYDPKLLHAIDQRRETIERILNHTQDSPGLKTEVSMRNR